MINYNKIKVKLTLQNKKKQRSNFLHKEVILMEYKNTLTLKTSLVHHLYALGSPDVL